MREIIFRGKRIYNGEWVEGNLVFSLDADEEWRAIIIPIKNSYMFSSGNKDEDLGFENWHRVDFKTVCQYTGQTDKNGKKIFEGDILVIRNCREHPVLVKFLDFSWQCVIPNVNAYIHYRHRLENNDTKYEVIGNIHDNPEFLEVGE